jgi:putative phosphoribosyl transferase
MTYRDRRAAGAALAERLARYADRPDVVVLGLVRGGVPVAAEVARRLGAPLDVLVVRKLGVPWAPEVAFGALGPGGVRVLNDDIAARLPSLAVSAVVRHESGELATGATARAAVAVARALGARTVVVAVPVGADDAVAQLATEADEVVCPWQPERFGAVSRYYDDFGQVSDAQVNVLLRADAGGDPPAG